MSTPVDYRYMSVDGKKPSKLADPDASPRWWEGEDDVEVAQGVTSALNALAGSQSRRDLQTYVNARLYGNLVLMGLHTWHAPKTKAIQPTGNRNHLTFNLVQSGIDTVTAKIAKNKPKPYFLTNGGSYRQIRKAKKLDQFVDGIFYQNDYYKLAVEVFRDACVFGTGVVHVFNRDGQVAFERVLSTELYVDEQEAFYGFPRQLHRVKLVDRRALVAQFPEFKGTIEPEATRQTRPSVADMVMVRESWHLPSGPSAEDGLHAITLQDQVLFKEEWKRDSFPFAFIHWSKRLYGFWGQGAAEQIQGIQYEVNALLGLIQRSMKLAGSFKMLKHKSSKVANSHLGSNEIGTIIEWSGAIEPKWIVPPVVPQEMYNQLVALKESAYEQLGVSQLSAQSQKPAGLDSGKALRELNDIESDRFQVVGQAYERLALDVAKLAIATVKEITADRRSYKVKVPGNSFVSTVEWKDVCLKEDAYVMQLFPVSSLPNEPAGRLQTVQEMMQAGILTPAQGRRLLDYPDLDQVEGLANASIDYLEKIFDLMVDEGVYTAPEVYDDLQTARQMALQYYQQGKAFGLEEERLQLLRDFMSQLDDLTNPQNDDQEQAGQGAPPTGGPTQGQPSAPPQSDLMPFKQTG